MPTVALIVSCYNEAGVIRAKLNNSLELDYPKNKLEIIVISDGSEDATDDIAKEYANRGVQLIRQEGRLGKTAGLNLGVAATNAEIIVFSDANAMYDENAIRMLTRNFNDQSVGYVVGASLYTDSHISAAAQSEGTYWKYELFIKRLETELHSVVGGDGAIYAIRKALYEPLLAQDINDFVNPLQIIAKGFRGIFDAEAKCFEESAGDFHKEAKRKQRIVNRSFKGLMRVKGVMNPFRVGFYSLEIISHKLLRWLTPLFLIGIAVGSTYLSHNGYILFQLLVIIEALFFWLATIGFFKSKQESIFPAFYYPYYFLIVNYHSLLGVAQALQGNIQVIWTPSRGNNPSKSPSNVKTTVFGLALFLFSVYAFFNAIMGLLGEEFILL